MIIAIEISTSGPIFTSDFVSWFIFMLKSGGGIFPIQIRLTGNKFRNEQRQGGSMLWCLFGPEFEKKWKVQW